MSSYKTVVVGTDGSDSSLRAVDRAGALASGPDAKLVIATAYFPSSDDSRAADVLKDEGYKMSGNAPIYAILREAKDRAKAAGATSIEEKAIVGAPVDALVDLAEEVKADLLVVGNVGLSTIAGRLLGLRACQRLPALEGRRADRPHYRLAGPGSPHRLASGATATKRPVWWYRRDRQRCSRNWPRPGFALRCPGIRPGNG